MSSGERGSHFVKMSLPSSLLQALELTRPSTQQSSAPVVYLRMHLALGILPRPLSNENEVELTFSAKNDRGYTTLSLVDVQVVGPSSSATADGLSKPGEWSTEETGESAPTATPSSPSVTTLESSSPTRRLELTPLQELSARQSHHEAELSKIRAEIKRLVK